MTVWGFPERATPTNRDHQETGSPSSRSPYCRGSLSAANIAVRPAIAPKPTSAHASRLLIGGTTRKRRSQIFRDLREMRQVAGCSHIKVFIAGARITGR